MGFEDYVVAMFYKHYFEFNKYGINKNSSLIFYYPRFRKKNKSVYFDVYNKEKVYAIDLNEFKIFAKKIKYDKIIVRDALITRKLLFLLDDRCNWEVSYNGLNTFQYKNAKFIHLEQKKAFCFIRKFY